MLRIDTKALPDEGADLEGEEDSSLLDLPGAGGDGSPASPIRYALHLQMAGHELIASGRVEVDVAFLCVRCVEPFTLRIEEPSFLSVRDMKEEEIEQFVDLTPDIRESILLAFPSHPVCKPECRGLCPQCGRNWNHGLCECRSRTDDRWGGLDIPKTQS